MERRSFLKALGLLGAVAALPAVVIETAQAIAPAEALPVAPASFFRPVRLGDIVILKDGTQARVTNMNSISERPTVKLRPVECKGDLGNGMGMDKEYDKDTLPDLVDIVYASCVGEGESRVVEPRNYEAHKDKFPYAAVLNSL